MKLSLLSALFVLFVGLNLAGIIAWCGGDVDKILPKSRFR